MSSSSTVDQCLFFNHTLAVKLCSKRLTGLPLRALRDQLAGVGLTAVLLRGFLPNSFKLRPLKVHISKILL
jgi:hypothetical protein